MSVFMGMIEGGRGRTSPIPTIFRLGLNAEEAIVTG